MDCLRCGKPLDSGAALCKECLQQGRIGPVIAKSSTPRAGLSAPLWILILLAVIAAWFFWPTGVSQLPALTLPSTAVTGWHSSDPCLRKRKCLVLALAPWCPACHAALPFIRGLSKDLASEPQVGLKIIVSMGDLNEMWDMAREIGGVTFVDEKSEFAAAVGSVAVPHWWLTDQNGKVLDHFSGAFSSYGPESRRRFFELYLPELAD